MFSLFWGWEKELPAFGVSHGLPADARVSAVMVNSEKGAALFQRVRPRLICDEVPYDKIRRHNGQLCTPVQIDAARRERIVGAYSTSGYPGLVGIYREMTDYRRYSTRIARLIPSGLKDKIKIFLRKRRDK